MAEASTRHLAQRKATPSCSPHGIDQSWWSDGLGRVWAIWPTVRARPFVARCATGPPAGPAVKRGMILVASCRKLAGLKHLHYPKQTF